MVRRCRANPHETEADRVVFCRGDSMRPLFRPGDRIRFIPCLIEELRRGDVIIFMPPGQKERIIHRVISAGISGIRTKGDSNPFRDKGECLQQDLIGRAASIERGGRKISVTGGAAGHFMAIALRVFRRLDHGSSRLFHPVYHGLSRSGIIKGLVPSRLAPRVIILQRPGGVEKQILMGTRLIGQCLPGESEWRIKRPYRLFVDERVMSGR